MHESSFKHLLTNLSLLINGLLEMWLGLLTFYFWSLKDSQKIFLGSNLECRQKIVLKLVILLLKVLATDEIKLDMTKGKIILTLNH